MSDMTADFSEHNAESELVWSAYRAGSPTRIPMIIGMNPRMVILDSKYSRGVTFEQYYNDAQTMLDMQLEFRRFEAFEMYYDHRMGLPENGWYLYPDFQNDTECGWLGAELKFSGNAVPFTVPMLNGDNPRDLLFKKGFPELFGGLLGKAFEFYNYFIKLKNDGFEYMGKPISNVGFPGFGTDGPMTLACMLRGTTEFCIDLYEDTAYAEELLDYLTDAAVFRIRGLRRHFGMPEISPDISFADDSIALLSPADYERFVLPRHKRLISELTDGTGKNQIHLCGDATRHFGMIADELNVASFDTGYPINFREMLQLLGPDVTISGGVRVSILSGAQSENIRTEVRRICGEVKPLSKKFILRDANNLAPGTPPENVRAMYNAVREYGRF